MIVTNSIEETRKLISEKKTSGSRVAFVPTMGALHEGHLSLVDIAKKNADYVVMSIFVNKIQFNDSQDFEKYPRVKDADSAKAESVGVDLIFAPDDSVMYNNQCTFVDVDFLTDTLCGAFRPGHFKGVFTVVAKLFNIVQPDVAVFGQKDIQQALTIEKMVFDLNFPVEIIKAPIVRENDGLALSSRNIHLNSSARTRALCIYHSLCRAKELVDSGEFSSVVIESEMIKIIKEAKPEKIDYVSIVDYNTLHKVDRINKKAVIAVAVYFDGTRLIDNMIVNFEGAVECVF